MKDDFFKKPHYPDMLTEWFSIMKYAKSSEVAQWGVDHFCVDAGRLARRLADRGVIRRMSEERKAQVYGFIPNMKEKAWEWNGETIDR